jgi:hypothetical protein
MARTALYSPAHRVLQRSALGQLYPGNSPNAAPSMDFMGSGFQDHRLPWNSANSAAGAQALGFYGGSSGIITTDEVPSTLSTANIAALQNVVSGIPMTLVAASGAGITVLPAGGQVWFPFLNTVPAGACIIDGTQALVRFGLNDITGFYDPTAGISRGVSITGVAASVGGAFLLSGIDYYGQNQTQTLTHAGGATTINSTKTFKGVVSVTPQFTDAHTYSVGTADLYGFGIAADFFSYVNIFWNNVLQLVATFTAAVATTPSLTTGDVRGTFTPGSASNGAIRLQISITPSLVRAKANTIWGVVPA